MKLRALTWSRYRAFKERHRVAVAPLTIIIGKNGSGKSVVTRLPVLIADAIRPDAVGPLNLTAGKLDHGASFQDLVNARSALPFTLGMEVGDENQTYEFETTLRYIVETRSLAVEAFALKDKDDSLLRIEIADAADLMSGSPLYKVNHRGSSLSEGSLDFSGLLPEIPSTLLSPAYRALRSALDNPSYLGPFRAEAERFLRTPNQDVRDLGPRGENALEMLADDVLRRGGKLASSVQEWFVEAMGQGVAIDTTSEQPRVYVLDSSGFEVALSDTGAGFTQSLPIVVQHLAYRAGRIASPLLVVEQPELHLHPAAHGALADLVVGTATGGSSWAPAVCMVETHSEQFIMRVRRRIAEGIISPDSVKIWSLNHLTVGDVGGIPDPLRVISFDSDGNPDDWPVGVFEEALDDLTALRQSVRER